MGFTACSSSPDSVDDIATETDAQSVSVTVGAPATGGDASEPSGSHQSGDDSEPSEASNEAPTASFTISPLGGPAPLVVQLDASGSSDPDGTLVAFDWSFGDGTSGSGERAEHDYDEPGCYEVELTVTDDEGATATATATVVALNDEGGAEDPPAVTIESEPRPGAVLPRDLETNEGYARFTGTLSSPGFGYVRAEAVKDGVVVAETLQPLCGDVPASFDVSAPIPAELSTFEARVSVVSGDQTFPIASVPDLVAGDLYIIQGQSNAVSPQYSGNANENQSPFLRTFGITSNKGKDIAEDVDWHRADGDAGKGQGAVGQWPIRMARKLSDAHQLPIGLINGADGGEPVGFFQRNDADPTDLSTNYGRMLTRARNGSIDQHFRAVLWYQGESSGGDAESHRAGFLELYDDWQEDFPSIERVYVTQIRDCGSNLVRVQEVQRALPDEFEMMTAMSTTGLDGHDGCHFAYANGYRELGDRYAALLGRDLYGEDPATDVAPPNPASARFQAGGTEIVVEMRNQDSALTWEDGVQGDFKLEGSSVEVESGRAEGNTIVLELSGDGSGAAGLTYLGGRRDRSWVTNENGIGLLTFHSLPVAAE